MPLSVHIIWWITLALALGITVLATAYLILVVRECGQILELARRTIPSAQLIARNTKAIASLTAVLDLAPTLLNVAGNIDRESETIASTIESVAPRASA